MAPNEDHEMSNTAPINLAVRSSSNGPSSDNKKHSSATASSASESEDATSSSESDDSTSDEDEEQEQIATITAKTKPNFSARVASGAPSLEDRLKSFLPQMAAANSKLEEGGENEYSMEAVKDDEPHIEMDLGLGVLEETNGKEGEDSSDDEDEEAEDVDGEVEGSPESKRKEKDVMGKLMGKKENQTAGIEEVG